jgi:SET domain-containing protein
MTGSAGEVPIEGVVFGRSPIHGRGAFAGRRFDVGEQVWTLAGRSSSISRLAVRIALRRCGIDDPLQVGRWRYIELDDESIAFNHSCDPNLGVTSGNVLVARRPIEPGDELTYDYATTVLASPFTWTWSMPCACGSPMCRRTIRRADRLPASVARTYVDEGSCPDHTRPAIERAASGAVAG